MKKGLLWLVLGLTLLTTACSPQNQGQANSSDSDTQIESNIAAEGAENNDQTTGESDSRILIAYFAVAENSAVEAVSSASVGKDSKGLLRILADDIQKETGGDLFSIKTSVKYPGGINELIDYADKEQADNARPELTSHIDNLNDYDVIFVGYPNWWADMPMVMYSFFEENDFSGKTIIPFNVHNGSRFSNTINTIKNLEPGATVVTDGFTVNQSGVANADTEVQEWLKGLGF